MRSTYKIIKVLEVQYTWNKRRYKTPHNAAEAIAFDIVNSLWEKRQFDMDHFEKLLVKAERRLLPIMKRILE